MPSTETVWVNVYSDLNKATGSAHASREAADTWRKGRIACIEVQFTKGQGLYEDELKGLKWSS